MVCLKLNFPGVFAYSICLRPGGFITMHAHIQGESYDFYRESSIGRPSIWQYMPIDKDEHIFKIWNRKGFDARELAIMVRFYLSLPVPSLSQVLTLSTWFQTNKNRTMIFGPYRRRDWGHSIWILLFDQFEKQPIRLYFDESSNGVRYLAFETPSPSTERQVPNLPNPQSTHCPPCLYIEDYFYTSASLEDITTLTTCQREQDGTIIIIGLLFTYSNGRQSCVGQIRCDSLGPSQSIIPTTRLSLGFLLEDRKPRVAKVCISEESECNELIWLRVPWTGVLEWWFSIRQCKIYHGNQESPETRQE